MVGFVAKMGVETAPFWPFIGFFAVLVWMISNDHKHELSPKRSAMPCLVK